MADSRLRGSDSTLLAGALVLAAFFVAFGALHYGFYTKNVLLDTPLYERYGDAVVHGGAVPYRDFALEYPPGALLAFAAPSLIAPRGDFRLYARLFEGLMLLCGAFASALVAFVLAREGAGRRRLVGATLLAGLAPLALGPVVLSRFDLWPAALTVAALAALISGRRSGAFALLALGVAVKLYPLVLLPLAVAYVWRREGRRAALGGFAVFAAVLAVCVLPFVAASPQGVWSSLAGELRRPLQIESLGASLLLAGHQLWGLPLHELSSHGSDNLSGGAAQQLALAQSLLALAALGALWVAFARGEPGRDRLLRYAAAAVCAFVALDKVLSPQYLIWLFALVPLVRGRRGIAAGALFVASMLLTQLWFPRAYISLVYGLDARASWFVLARDVTLVALLVTLAWPAGRGRRAGPGLVVVLVSAATAAALVGVATSAPAGASRHSGLLAESGRASRCGGRLRPATVTAGSVAYESVGLVSPARGGACVNVELSGAGRVQLFSAAYRGAFDAADPRIGLLGAAGSCTNVAGLSGRRVSYSFALPPRSRFAVEVEDCSASIEVPPYLVEVDDGPALRGVVGAASAARRGGVVRLVWRALHEPAALRFTLYREDGGTALLTALATVPGKGAGRRSYSFADPAAPLVRTLRYWILARTPEASWSLSGPLAVNG